MPCTRSSAAHVSYSRFFHGILLWGCCSHVVGSKDGWKTLITKDEPAYELGDGMDVWEMISSEQSKLTYPICNYTGCPFIRMSCVDSWCTVATHGSNHRDTPGGRAAG